MPAAKSDRLKQAKADADKEVAAYKAERESTYKEKMASVRHHSRMLPADGLTGHTVYPLCAPSFAALSMSVVFDPALPWGVQNSSSAGDTVKRLAAESDEQVKQIQQNVAAHKTAVRFFTPRRAPSTCVVAWTDVAGCRLLNPRNGRLHWLTPAGGRDPDQIRDDRETVSWGLCGSVRQDILWCWTRRCFRQQCSLRMSALARMLC